MKLKFALCFLLAFALASSLAWAGGKIPSLVGKWNVETVGGLMLSADEAGKDTHWTPGQKVMKGQIEIVSQEDRFVSGTFTSSRGTEKFIAMISADGKCMYASDTDGFFDAKIINKNTIEIVYRHVKASDSVIAVGVAKRQK